MPADKGPATTGLRPLVVAARVSMLVACAGDGPAHRGELAAPPRHGSVTRPMARLEGRVGQGIRSCSYCTRGRARTFNAQSCCVRRQCLLLPPSTASLALCRAAASDRAQSGLRGGTAPYRASV
eukprot:1960632-Alexandrium_andersonii.AAC.1